MPLPAIAAALMPVVSTLIDRLIPDKDAAAKAKLEMEAQLVATANQVNLAQIDVNKKEAEHSSIFVAGWRPAIGWVCSIGLAWTFIGQPIAEWIMALKGIETELPSLQTEYLLELVLALLGMAGLRTFEKLRGVARQQVAQVGSD